MSTDPEQKLERDISELEERVDGLDESIKEARDHADVDVIAGQERPEPADDEAS